VKVVLLVLRPEPPKLSATLPLKLVGMPVAWKKPPSAGVVTEAVVGAVLSTVNVAPGPAARAGLPAVSVAVPAAMEIPRVPSPLMLDRVTVRVVVPVPLTATDAVAVPVVLRVMLLSANVTELAPP